jgi:hypothetical protein
MATDISDGRPSDGGIGSVGDAGVESIGAAATATAAATAVAAPAPTTLVKVENGHDNKGAIRDEDAAVKVETGAEIKTEAGVSGGCQHDGADHPQDEGAGSQTCHKHNLNTCRYCNCDRGTKEPLMVCIKCHTCMHLPCMDPPLNRPPEPNPVELTYLNDNDGGVNGHGKADRLATISSWWDQLVVKGLLVDSGAAATPTTISAARRNGLVTPLGTLSGNPDDNDADDLEKEMQHLQKSVSRGHATLFVCDNCTECASCAGAMKPPALENGGKATKSKGAAPDNGGGKSTKSKAVASSATAAADKQQQQQLAAGTVALQGVGGHMDATGKWVAHVGNLAFESTLGLCHTCTPMYKDNAYCPVCLYTVSEEGDVEEDNLMMHCDRCDRWTHAACEGMSEVCVSSH